MLPITLYFRRKRASYLSTISILTPTAPANRSAVFSRGSTFPDKYLCNCWYFMPARSAHSACDRPSASARADRAVMIWLGIFYGVFKVSAYVSERNNPAPPEPRSVKIGFDSPTSFTGAQPKAVFIADRYGIAVLKRESFAFHYFQFVSVKLLFQKPATAGRRT